MVFKEQHRRGEGLGTFAVLFIHIEPIDFNNRIQTLPYVSIEH